MCEGLWSVVICLGILAVLFGLPFLCFGISEWRRKKRNPDIMRPKEYARYIERKGEDPNEY